MAVILVLATTAILGILSQSVESTSSAIRSTLVTSRDRQLAGNWNRDWNRWKKFNCPSRNGRFPHTENCEYYIECRYGRATLMQCNSGYHYDEELKHCREKSKVHCHKENKDKDDKGKDEVTFKCPSGWGTFAHPTDCSRYFACRFNVATLRECDEAELFDERTKKCLRRNRVDCGKRLDRYRITAMTTTVTTPAPTTVPTTQSTEDAVSCSVREIVVATTMTTPEVTTTTIQPTTIRTTEIFEPSTFSSSTETSTEIPVTKANTPPPTNCADEDLDCIVKETGDITKWFNCPKKHGFYPHGSSKKLFIHCNKWKPVVKRCTDGTVFIPEYEACVSEN